MSYTDAKAKYAKIGVDTDKALEKLAGIPVSIHCWQGDDVTGFDNKDGGAGNGIQTTGNYPGKARNFDELCADFLKAAELIPGKKRINLHACYAVYTAENGGWVDRDEQEYKHFSAWVDFAKKNDINIDFNPTLFSHPMVKDGLTLSSPDDDVRAFWVKHCIATRRIANEIGKELGSPVLNNVWIPDGFKDVPSDRMGPRLRLKDSLDKIFEEKMPNVIDCVESKFFAIGVEAYTVGSNEFYMGYATSRNDVCYLLDAGHFHPSEYISDKISSLLCYFDKVPLHVTRPMNWDSDHVVNFTDEIIEICKEIVRNDALDRVLVGLDFFDASINRIAAWAIGTRAFQKAMLFALLQPCECAKKLQDEGNFTKKMMVMEDAKMMPISDVWEEYLRRQNVKGDFEWFEEVEKYETEVLVKRV